MSFADNDKKVEVLSEGGDTNPDGATQPATHKEKSVLQAKLTKLAIQIGYVGK